MKLRQPCEHGRYDGHEMPRDLDCRGGEFLAPDALVIEKEQDDGGRWWPEWALNAFIGATFELGVSVEYVLDTLQGADPDRHIGWSDSGIAYQSDSGTLPG